MRTQGVLFSLAAIAQVENLTATGSENFTGTGNALANTIKSGQGNDLLDGGAGADSLDGGSGNDTYIVDNAGDVIADGAGIDAVRASVSFVLGEGLERLILTGTAAISATGNGADNILAGNEAANRLSGGDGNDHLDGGAGADVLQGGLGNDTFIVDNAGDTLSDTGGIDWVQITTSFELGEGLENIQILGLAALSATGNTAANTLIGNSADNLLQGLDGNDLLDGRGGRDTMMGGAGNDLYYVDRTDDVAYDTSGLDRVVASAGYTLGFGIENLTLAGTSNLSGAGNGLANSIIGNAAGNVVRGLAGNDILVGNAGSDVLSGGSGIDRLTGGIGADRFLFDAAASSGADRITDFSVVDDTIALARNVFTGFAATGVITSGQYYAGAAAHDADDRLIYNAANGYLTYDSNGNAAGGASIIAVLSTGLTLSRFDFLIV